MNYNPEIFRLMQYVLGAAHDLEKMGILKGSVGVKITDKGIAQFDQLKASGYKPTDSELLTALTYLSGDSDVAVYEVFRAYRDGTLPENTDTKIG